jgi:hypothetical protein
MYNIEKRPSGYILTFSGDINSVEMKQWYADSEFKLLTNNNSSFGIIVKVKDLQSITPAARTILVEGQKLYRKKGMKRSAVLFSNIENCRLFKNLALQSGIYNNERYILCPSRKIEHELVINELAVNWVKEAIEPAKIIVAELN